jgi:hypothetical protein
VKAIKANTHRFSHMFGKMRRYRHKILYFSSIIWTPQSIVAI